MPGGKLGKAVVISSILLALGLIGLGVWTRKDALVASLASAQTYREARLEGAELSFTWISKWPWDQAFRFGRAVRTPQMERSGMIGVSRSLALLNQTEAVLDKGDATASWWPAVWTEGGAFQRKYGPGQLTFAGGTTAMALPTTAPSVTKRQGAEVAKALGKTMVSGSFDIASVKSPATMPNAIIASIFPEPNTLTMQSTPTATLPNPTRADTAMLSVGRNVETVRTPIIVNDRKTMMTTGTLRYTTAAPYSYERYAMPLWPVVVVVLTPVWVAAVRVLARWVRRRGRRRRGLCTACGYDLRGNPSSGTCPECGASEQKIVLGASNGVAVR